LTPVFKQLLSQVGLSENPSWIGRIDLFSFDWKTWRIAVNENAWKSRAEKALDILFSVAAEIATERKLSIENKLPKSEDRVVIIFDELLDLVRQDRFADVGGVELMDKICGLVVHHNIDEADICVFFAGSSGFLLKEIGQRRLHGRNCEVLVIADPTAEEVIKALKEKNYEDHIVKRIVDDLGCRLRLLSPILDTPTDVDNVVMNIARVKDAAERDINDLFENGCKDENCRRQCRLILDELTGLKSSTKVWRMNDLPVDVRNHRAIKILYVDQRYMLHVQDVPVRLAWIELSDSRRRWWWYYLGY